MIETVLAIICEILGILWFLAPFFTKHIRNIGNITGILVCLLAMTATITKLPVLSYLTLCIILIGLIFVGISLYARMKRPSGRATVIVLGCRVYGKTPSLMLCERLDAATCYLNENKGCACIVCGGQGDDEEISEALCMKNYLIGRGIDEAIIYLDDTSKNTRQNIENAVTIQKEQGLPHAAVLVSNEFHIYRARRIAKRCGLDALGVAAPTAWWLLPTFFVREIYSILNDWFFKAF